MAIQAQDLPYSQDAQAVLGRMKSPQAKVSAGSLRNYAFEAPDGPIRGENPPAQEMADFVAELGSLLNSTTRDLRQELEATTLLDCLTVGILLGQDDKALRMVTGSPNTFTYEMEFLASLSPRIEGDRRTKRRQAEAAFNCLRLARQHRILSENIGLAKRYIDSDGTLAGMHKGALRTQLAVEWVSVRGSFDTRYDWAYSRRLADRITKRGVHHPSIDAIPALLHNVMHQWARVINRFQSELADVDGQLYLTVRQHTLLDLPGHVRLKRRTSSLLMKCCQRLIIGFEDLLAGVSPLDAGKLSEWLDLLTLDSANIGKNVDAGDVFDSPLTAAPVIATRRGYLISLVHIFSTELSRLLERIFARAPGLHYYRARGEELEESAVALLRTVFSDSTIMHSGKYPGDRPGELIEVDGIVLWHDVAIVIEGKGGYLSARSRRGDEASAIGDYRDTVGDGFFQASRLLQKLERDGNVDLTGKSGGKITLDCRAIRRAYVLIPTADQFGGILTSLDLFWRAEILPPGSIPLIVSIQELNLMADILCTPLEFIAYLDYREQILANPAIHVADEGELLGNFVGGNDVLAEIHAKVGSFSYEQSRPEWRNRQAAYFIGTDAQQTYLNPWIIRSTQMELAGVDTTGLEPPRRHGAAHRAEVERHFVVHKDLPAASILMQLPDLPWRAETPPRPRRGYPAIAVLADTCLVGFAVGDKVAQVRRLPRVSLARTRMRHIVYLQVKDGQLHFRHAEAGREHPFFGDANKQFTDRSRLGDQSMWFPDFARRRHGSHRALTDVQAEERDTLIRAGLPHSLAAGVSRLGLVNRVLDLVDDDISLSQAADTYLTYVRNVADAAGVAVTDLSVTPELIKESLRLVRRSEIDRGVIPELLRIAIHEPDSSLELLAQNAGLLAATTNDVIIMASIESALKNLGIASEEFELLTSKQQKKVRNRVLGHLRASSQTLNMASVARILEVHLSSGSDAAAPGG